MDMNEGHGGGTHEGMGTKHGEDPQRDLPGGIRGRPPNSHYFLSLAKQTYFTAI